MDKIDYTIDAYELYERAKDIINAGMDYAVISLCEPDDSDPDIPLPASVHFDAFSKREPAALVDFEDIDVIPPEVWDTTR